MSWKTGLAWLLGHDVDEGLRLWGEPGTPEFEKAVRARRAEIDASMVDITPASGPIAYTPEEDAQGGKVPGTAGHELAAARELLERERAFAPHCDARILHAPGECWTCDLYPDWQALREKWAIAFTGQTPLSGVACNQLPCPADYNRPPDSKSDHRQWGPNTAQGEHP